MVTYLKKWVINHSVIVLFALNYLVFCHLLISFRQFLILSVKKQVEILIVIARNLHVVLGKIVIFIMLLLPVHVCGDL